jgi:hypothetical protein
MNYTIFVSLSQTFGEQEFAGLEEELICFWFDVYTKEWVLVFPYLSFDRTIELQTKNQWTKVYGDYLSQSIPFVYSKMTYGGLLQVCNSIPQAGWEIALSVPYTFVNGYMEVTENHSEFHPAEKLTPVSSRVKPYLPLGIKEELEVDLLGEDLLKLSLAYFQETEPEQVDYRKLYLAKNKLKNFFSPLEIEFFSRETVIELASLIEGLE